MIRALLLAACLAMATAFMTQPVGDPSCVDVEPEEIQRRFQSAVEAGEIEEGTPSLTSCADVEAIGGCEDALATEACCASCEVEETQRESRFGAASRYWSGRRRRRVLLVVYLDPATRKLLYILFRDPRVR